MVDGQGRQTRAEPRHSSAASTEKRRTPSIGGVLLSMLLAALDQTIVAPAMPTIGGALGHADYLPWIVTAYLLTATAMAPLYGKISDIYGRRPTIYAAILIFLAGSVISALAPNMLVLIARPRRPGHRRRRPVRPGADGDRRSRAAARTGALRSLDLGHVGGRQHRRAAAWRHLCRASALVADLLDQHSARPASHGDHQRPAEEAARRGRDHQHRRPGRAAADRRDRAPAARAELGRQHLSVAVARNPRAGRGLRPFSGRPSRSG